MNAILKLEADRNYIPALEEYRKAYAENPSDYRLWRHYYFFLWYLTVEDYPLGLQDFVADQKIADELKVLGDEGIKRHRGNPDALFVLGYTIGIFPYLFGDYTEWENTAKQFLESAHVLSPEDKIYKLAYLGSIPSGAETEYLQACKTAAPEVISRFEGNDLFNSYFREVLYRAEGSNQ
ncbi:hypothetical protein [Flavobacterium sp.]|uniref:hypothetical protein n=1 Tax=Flavobacterium sp. TaxID=239 RepID=UPI0012060238|nr:hypothetical protein [Flavobacterium sp.]RZJ69691.1 MAG: hypothetical protein EOO49_16295 [Flavobacterium sp.]